MLANIVPPLAEDRREHAIAVAPQPRSLRRNFAWTLTGNVVYAGCQWAILVVIAKLTSPAALGQFALGLAITAPVLIFANQGLRDLQATDARRNFEFRQYLRYRLLSITAALAFIVAVTWICGYPLVVILVGVSKAVESIIDLVHGQYQQHERMDWMATSFMLRGCLSLITVAILLIATRSIAWGAAGLIFANCASLLIYDWRPGWLFGLDSGLIDDLTRVRARASFSGAARGLVIAGLPLGLAQMLNSLSVNVPRYFLERHAGAASLGIFAAIMYLLVAGRTVTAALALSCVARLARYYADGDVRAFKTLLLKQIGLALGFGAAGIIFSVLWGGPLLRLFYGREYAEYAGVLVLGMVVSALNHLADFTGTALTAVRSLTVQPFILGTCVVVGCAVSAVLVPRHGIAGAAWAVLFIAVCQLGLYICALCYAFYRRERHIGVAEQV